jgi:hypothetical protein
MNDIKQRELFIHLFQQNSEEDLVNELANIKGDVISWLPLGGNENNYGVIENQQASPIAALIEKITNSIDATLMRRCLEEGLNPKSNQAPQTMEQAIERFFATKYKQWHLTGVRRTQAESIQIIASGSKQKPCLLIYDDGEGQHPQHFESTFLSLLKGNKNDIPFVQGKYNMGGTGAIVFCGKNRFQLIGSRRYDKTGNFGFTLVREHPLTVQEARKNTWYEYLKINNQIPNFSIDELELGLWNRKFKHGTIIKLFDYELPQEARGGAITHDFRRSINEFLFEPALPILLVDSKERYPKDKVLDLDAFGLKRRLDNEDNKYIEQRFSIDSNEHDIGRIKITCYIFKSKVDDKSVKETRDTIQREFFRNGMAVLFSLNGQVHGHLTSEFITRSLKMPLLKHHLLIHVDCTNINYEFRKELFMASRDRLKAGDNTADLRDRLSELLIKSELSEIYNRRKNAIGVEGSDAKDLLRSFSKNLPLNKDLIKLLNNAFTIEQETDKERKPEPSNKTKPKKEKEPFNPKRYPSYFKLKTGSGEQFITIPAGNEKNIQFVTDVEDNYFDRSDDPGDLKVTILQFRRNETTGEQAQGAVTDPSKLLDIRKSSPQEGTIRIGLSTTAELKVGNEIEIRAVLGGPEDFENKFWVKIVEPKKEKKETEEQKKDEPPPIGLPNYILVYNEKHDDQPNAKTWNDLTQNGIEMDWVTVMHPYVEEDQLKLIYINMDSTVLRNFISHQGNISVEQKELAEKRYISSVYFHTIFLYTITKNKNYEVRQQTKEIDLEDYLKDIFSAYYCEFLLNFGTEELIQSLSE